MNNDYPPGILFDNVDGIDMKHVKFNKQKDQIPFT
jgi:hypothetical protein